MCKLKTKSSAGSFGEAYFPKLFKLFKLEKKAANIFGARARGRLGMPVWRCVGAYESATFFFFFFSKIKKKKLLDQNVFLSFFLFFEFLFLFYKKKIHTFLRGSYVCVRVCAGARAFGNVSVAVNLCVCAGWFS